MIVKLFFKNTPFMVSAVQLWIMDVTKCTSPTSAFVTSVKSIALNCTLPVIKYPVLCATLATCTVTTNGLLVKQVATAAVTVGEAILEEVEKDFT